MDKWVELKSWTESGINNLKELMVEQVRLSSEWEILKVRKIEFEQFLQKMIEIEKMCEQLYRQICEYKYQCPECQEISTNEEWNNKTRMIFDDDILEIGYEDYENAEFICPKCEKEIFGYNIHKI
jgi:RNA polymerase subunit RPABC4/transcription elongation factor Spt4